MAFQFFLAVGVKARDVVGDIGCQGEKHGSEVPVPLSDWLFQPMQP